jgi:hypothetical protein
MAVAVAPTEFAACAKTVSGAGGSVCRSRQLGDGAGGGIVSEAEAQRANEHQERTCDSLLCACDYYRSSEFFPHANPDDPHVMHPYGRSIA